MTSHGPVGLVHQHQTQRSCRHLLAHHTQMRPHRYIHIDTPQDNNTKRKKKTRKQEEAHTTFLPQHANTTTHTDIHALKHATNATATEEGIRPEPC